jgi:SpoVK/Ycf46/Vps4 family AAA+-type ATPase
MVLLSEGGIIMATIEQIKALIRMHFDDNDEKFRTIALQIAAHESKIGHTTSANEIRDIIQNSRIESKKKILKFTGKSELVEQKVTGVRLKDIVLSDNLHEKVERIIIEYKKRNLLRKNGLKNRSKVLITGAPGTGKTMTAAVLSSEVQLPLFVIQIDKLITKYMGETSVKLRQVFELLDEIPGVYLFDEFDAIGSDRSLDNDVGEMRRILNTFLMGIENNDSNSIIVAATNNPKLLDKALFRRFDDVLEYSIPNKKEIKRLFKLQFCGLIIDNGLDDEIYECSLGLSQADITNACKEAIKYSILNDTQVNKAIVLSLLEDRKKSYYFYEG